MIPPERRETTNSSIDANPIEVTKRRTLARPDAVNPNLPKVSRLKVGAVNSDSSEINGFQDRKGRLTNSDHQRKLLPPTRNQFLKLDFAERVDLVKRKGVPADTLPVEAFGCESKRTATPDFRPNQPESQDTVPIRAISSVG